MENYSLEYAKPLNKTVTEKCIYEIGKDGEWKKITFTADSGAVDHVIRKDEADWFPLKDTAMSKAGKNYTAANGGIIRNYGGRELKGKTESKYPFQMNVQVTDARKNLASLPKMVEEGNDIQLSKKKGCFIINEKTGMKIPMRLQPGGTPEFDLWLKRGQNYGKYGVLNVDGEADITENGASAFQRLEEWI